MDDDIMDIMDVVVIRDANVGWGGRGWRRGGSGFLIVGEIEWGAGRIIGLTIRLC